MGKTIKFAGLSVDPGKKLQDYVNIESVGLKFPVTVINGVHEGKTVVITSGIHGGEYPGIETAIRLASCLKPEDVKGSLIIAHPVNEAAFYKKTQYVSPLDGKNLNRSFPGEACGTTSQVLAYTVTNELFKLADFYMDLHGGDIHEDLMPFVICTTAASEEVNACSKKMASLLIGVEHVIGSVSTSGTFGWAAQMGIPGFLAEIGGCGLWSENDVSTYVKAVKNVLKALGVLDGEPEPNNAVFHEKTYSVSATVKGLWYPAVKKCQTVKKGDAMGQIKDVFGKVLAEYKAEADGIVFYVISSLPINEGEPIYSIG